MQQTKEKVRVYILARELNIETKDLLDLCQQAGFDVKNQLSSLSPEQRDAVEQMVRQSGGGVAVAAPPKAAVIPQVVERRVPVLPKAQAKPQPAPREPEPRRHDERREPVAPPTPAAKVTPPPGPTTPPQATPTPPSAPVVRPEPVKPAAQAPAPPAPPVTAPATTAAATPTPSVKPLTPPTTPASPAQHPPVKPSVAPPQPQQPPVVKTPEAPHATPAKKAPEPPRPSEPAAPPVKPLAAEAPPVKPAAPTPPSAPPVESRPQQPQGPMRDLGTPRVPPNLGGRVPDLGGGRQDGNQRRAPRPAPRPGVVVRAQPPLKKPSAEPKAQKPLETAQKPIKRLTAEELSGQVTAQEILKKASQPALLVPPTVPTDIEDEEGDKGKVRPGSVVGRDKRHAARNERAEQRKKRAEAEVRGGQVVLLDDDDGPRLRNKIRHKMKQQKPTMPRKGRVPVEPPLTVRALSEAIGLPAGQLLFKLRDHGAPAHITINSTLETEMAEVVALEVGVELDIKRPADAEELLLQELKKPSDPSELVPRAPVVTIMGHVDHGKTSLLDKIRRSNVAATEAGGITQVIRAWRVEHGGRPITFLDTPGHQAFTKMRARGANVTDIAVIVCAADDGVMPQTEEAINHAKAAGVSLIVAINKVDLPSANLNKTRQQLYGLNVLPDNMGGDVPFVETSAATGKGIDELLDNISVVAELKELKANPHRPASGTCLEAMLSEGEGVFATLLVQEGTLRRGDVILCGSSYGRVRALYNDLGRPIQEAGPSVPVRVTGLDEVPNADDPFVVVPDLAQAREIADKRRVRALEAAQNKGGPMRLEDLGKAKVAELKVILKADFRGSIEAIRKELEKLQHDEVRVRVLHTGIGGITESDVQLALTSPLDTIIVGFNVVPDDRALTMAEERGVQIREYDIIYNLTDDIKMALQGKLKPREEIVHLGRAVIRDTFKISRVGTIAGCYVTQGTIERSAKVRVIREGVVIYPPPDRTASLESLKRFKDDVKEVREGFECGLKVAGYDDVKVGDVVEAYRVEQVQRTL